MIGPYPENQLRTSNLVSNMTFSNSLMCDLFPLPGIAVSDDFDLVWYLLFIFIFYAVLQ